jgi:hypothetical protein
MSAFVILQQFNLIEVCLISFPFSPSLSIIMYFAEHKGEENETTQNNKRINKN